MEILNRMNIEAHQGRPLTPENKKLTFWRPSEKLLHCCIESKGCRFSRKHGACIMCDYGIGHNLLPKELEEALEEELKPYLSSVSTVLFGSYGSVLDTDEVSEECFKVVLDFIAKQSIKTVIFETHCCTVNDNILRKIREGLPSDTKLIIEMGYESCDPYVLKNCLNKVIDLGQLYDAIKLIHKYSMSASLNVFLGAPFMSTEEQLNTAVKSVEWAFNSGADDIVIFPCNIKPFTLMYRLFQNGIYKPVSQWMLVELLSRIPEDKLDCITLSWYGDRKNFYENDEFPLIPPEDCEKCHDKIFEFYYSFIRTQGCRQRKDLVEQFIRMKMECDCRDVFLRSLKVHEERKSEEVIMALLNSMNPK